MSCCTPTKPLSALPGLSGAWPGCAPTIWPRSPTFRRLPRWRAHGPRNLRAGGLETFRELAPHLDLFLYDIKHRTAHRRLTGACSRRILDNLRVLFHAWVKRF